MSYLSYAEPIEGNALLALSNSTIACTSVMATIAHKNLPNRGSGYLSGEYPDGITTIEGVPVSAEVRVLVRGEFGDDLDGAVVNTTTSAADGTWIVEGLDPDLKYDVVVRKEGYNDVMVTNVSPWNPPRLAVSAVTAYVAQAFNYVIPVIGGHGTMTVAISGTLPSGISFSAGALSGAWPTGATGEYPIVVTVTDGNGDSTSKTLTIVLSIHPLALPPSSAVPSVVIGQAFSYSFSASGGEGPYVYSISDGALPAGLSLNSSTGELSGIPTVVGAYSFSITATDVRSGTVSKAFAGLVSAPTITARYWRISITANNGHGTYVAVAEVELRAIPGGADQTSPASAAAGAATASSVANSANAPSLAFDDNAGTKWTAATTTGWIQYDAGTPIDVRQVGIMGQYSAWDQAALAPKDFKIQSSDDGVAWVDRLTVTGETGWAGAELRLFNLV